MRSSVEHGPDSGQGVQNRRDFTRNLAYPLLAAAVGWIAREERTRYLAEKHTCPKGVEKPPPPPQSPVVNLRSAPGIVEAIPDRTFRLVPYNNWPVFEIKVNEGQRLKFTREGGVWRGGSMLLIQRETPSEIDILKDEKELAEVSRRISEEQLTALQVQLPHEIARAQTRLTNARAELERQSKLAQRSATAEQDVRRASGLAALAESEAKELVQTKDTKLKIAALEVERAEQAARRADNEYLLADFKREFSWGNVPVSGGRFENVVITRVNVTRGMIPNGNGGREAWIEVVDDSELFLRVFVSDSQADQLTVGKPAKAYKGSRTFKGEILTIGHVADPTTKLVPVLVKILNPERALRLNTTISVDLEAGGGK